MAVVLKAATVDRDGGSSVASYGSAASYKEEYGDDQDYDDGEPEYVEPVAAEEIRVFSDGSIRPAGAFLSHGAVVTVDGLPGCYIYRDEHRDGKHRAPAVAVNSDTDDEQQEEEETDEAAGRGGADEEPVLGLVDRGLSSRQAARTQPELHSHRGKPYWSRVEARPKPVLSLYRSLISSRVLSKGFECTFAKVYVPESWDIGDLTWCKKGAWVEYNPGGSLPVPKLGVVAIEPIPSRGFSEVKLQFTDGTESGYIQTDSADMERCVVTQMIFQCEEHEAQEISHALKRAQSHGHPKHHGRQYELKLKGKGQVTLALAATGVQVTEQPEGPVRYNYRRVYPTTDGRIRKRHPIRPARTPSGDVPEAIQPPNTPLYKSKLGLEPPLEHFLGESPKPEELLKPWSPPEPEPEPEPEPTWREARQAEIEAEVAAKLKQSERGILARVFGCGGRSSGDGEKKVKAKAKRGDAKSQI